MTVPMTTPRSSSASGEERMFICPTFGTTCTPVDNRYPHPTNINSTGVTFLFPQRNYTRCIRCRMFLLLPRRDLKHPAGREPDRDRGKVWRDNLGLCWPTGSNGLWLRSNDVVEHLAIWNEAPGWVGSEPLRFFVLPVRIRRGIDGRRYHPRRRE